MDVISNELLFDILHQQAEDMGQILRRYALMLKQNNASYHRARR